MAVLLWPRTAALPNYEWDKTAYSEYSPGGASCQPAAIAALPTERERARKREACEEAAEQHRIDTNDLKQQTRSADAAAAAVVVAEWQAKATVLGLIIGFYTLVAAASAAYFAALAGSAAQGSLALERHAKSAQVRPYLYVDHIDLVEREPHEYRVTIWFKNYGSTPARHIQVRSFCYFGGDMLNLREFADYNHLFDAGVAPPNHTRRTFEFFYLTPNRLYRLTRRTSRLILRLEYCYVGDDRDPPYNEAIDYFLDAEGLSTKTFYLLTASNRRREIERREEMRSYRTERKLYQSKNRAEQRAKHRL
jgi:hypothetical protein